MNKGTFLIEEFLQENPDLYNLAGLIFSYDDLTDELYWITNHEPKAIDYFEKYSMDAQMRKWDYLVQAMIKGWPNGEHCGDCTHVPCACLRCQIEDYVVQAMTLQTRPLPTVVPK